MTFEPGPNAHKHKDVNPLLKLALELGPLLVFFFANARGAQLAEAFPALTELSGGNAETAPIFIATAFFMVAVAVSLILSWLLIRRLAVMPVVSGAIVAVFGTLTLVLQDDTFIKMKPTIVNLLFAGVLLGGLYFGRSLLGYVFDSVFKLDDEGWRRLTLRWGWFFVFLAVANEVVWRSFPTDFWVSFKVFGTMPITLVFSMAQLPLLNRHALQPIGGRSDPPPGE